MTEQPEVRYVAHLPDLMTADDYKEAHRERRLRFRVSVTDEGVEILGDSPYPEELERLLAALGPKAVEMMLCG